MFRFESKHYRVPFCVSMSMYVNCSCVTPIETLLIYWLIYIYIKCTLMVQEVVRHNANITNIMDKSLSYLFGMFYLFCDVAKNVFRSFRFFRVSSSDQDFQSDLIMFFYLNYYNVIIRRNIWRILNNNNIKKPNNYCHCHSSQWYDPFQHTIYLRFIVLWAGFIILFFLVLLFWFIYSQLYNQHN